MEEVKVGLRLCENEQQPHSYWAWAPEVVFVKNRADQWENCFQFRYIAPADVQVRGMQMWLGDRLLCYFSFGGETHTARAGETILIGAGDIKCHHGTPTAAYLELAATLTAIDESQEFEHLRRRLMGAVEEGKLWL